MTSFQSIQHLQELKSNLTNVMKLKELYEGAMRQILLPRFATGPWIKKKKKNQAKTPPNCLLLIWSIIAEHRFHCEPGKELEATPEP